MDSRIDLTEHRDFADNNPYKQVGLYKNFPWSMDDYPDLECSTQQELVFTGTKELIEAKKMVASYNAQASCDCCGAVFDSLFVERSKSSPGLCVNCDESLQKELHPYEGLNMSNEPIKSSDILVLEFLDGIRIEGEM